MKEIDIYDFDKTVIPFDSGSKFLFYCLLHNPWIIVCLPLQVAGVIPYLLKLRNFTYAKNRLFCFIKLINLEKNVKGFWDKYESKVFDWFKPENRARYTVVISASPDFLLEEICTRLKVDKLICTRHNSSNGTIIGLNCKGEEKVTRFYEVFDAARVIAVSSDSLKNDKPIFSLGERCFHVQKNGTRVEFDFNEKYI